MMFLIRLTFSANSVFLDHSPALEHWERVLIGVCLQELQLYQDNLINS